MTKSGAASRNIKAPSDIFAFGAMLYEMATGKRAFDGSSQASLIASILMDQPTPGSQLQPLAPPALERTIMQCLEKSPDDRWQTAGDLKRELKWLGTDTAGSTDPAEPGVPPDIPLSSRIALPRAAAINWLT